MNGSEISVSTGEKGNAGSITVPVGQNISLDNSKITASTSGQGNTGIINLRGTRKIQLVNNSEISNAVDEKGVGNAREINLDTAELSLENSEITSSTSGVGNAEVSPCRTPPVSPSITALFPRK
ncbi:MAG: hypothetical protein N5P05_003202 [Chroococcopsis gigantea SAG 12.99]|nr:hypothetical protein [Chroococcopsis gigantea SAG 12.99]